MKSSIIFILLILTTAPSLHSMEKDEKTAVVATDNNGNTIDWAAYRDLFFKWYEGSSLGTTEQWEGMKKGIIEGVIEVTPITKLVEWDKHYFLAYTKIVKLKDNKNARFMYPSPNNVYSGYPIKDTDILYTIDTSSKSGPLIQSQQWDCNVGDNNEQALPDVLHQPKEYFPCDWKNGKDFWVFWTNDLTPQKRTQVSEPVTTQSQLFQELSPNCIIN